jgi:hypothetical protein
MFLQKSRIYSKVTVKWLLADGEKWGSSYKLIGQIRHIIWSYDLIRFNDWQLKYSRGTSRGFLALAKDIATAMSGLFKCIWVLLYKRAIHYLWFAAYHMALLSITVWPPPLPTAKLKWLYEQSTKTLVTPPPHNYIETYMDPPKLDLNCFSPPPMIWLSRPKS